MGATQTGTVIVPTVDLEPWWAGGTEARARVAAALDEAGRTAGFMQIVGHRVPEDVIVEMRRVTDAYFALPMAHKRRHVPPDASVNRGYAAMGTEALSYSLGREAPPDLFEAFNIGEDVVDETDPFYAAERHRMFAERPEPGALLVNLGDLTAEWTNDRWRSTMHRVVPPPPDADGSAKRRSVAFFFDANWNALIECVPTCTDAEHPPKYPPVLAGEHLMAKLMGPRTLSPSDALDTAGGRGT